MKHIRSFILREGRFTRAQQHAIRKHWPTYGIEIEDLGDLHRVFTQTAPITLEIGFGNGLSLFRLAIQEPQNNFLGLEMHRPGIGRLLQDAAANKLSNLKVARADAYEAVAYHLPEQSLDRVLLLFPDPWPKQRHHKRRLFTAPFLARLARCMKPAAVLHLATDWSDYAEQIRQIIDASPYADILPQTRTGIWPCSETAFETRGRQAGREIVRLSCRRTPLPAQVRFPPGKL